MGWRIIRQPNGLLARFSEVVDNVTHYDMTEEEAIEVCREYMDRTDAAAKVRRGLADGLERFRDAIETIRAVHGDAEADRMERKLSRPGGTDR